MGRAAAEPMQLLFPGLSSSTNLRDRFEIGRELGRGGGGVVHTCHSLVTGKPIAACKSIPKYKLQRREVLMELRNEIDTMLKLRGHPHIVELQGLYEDAGAVHLIMDLCEGGDLYEYLAANVTLPEKVAAMVVKQVLRALRHCHENGVVHRDVKPENILITKPVAQPPISTSSTMSSGSRSTSSSSGSPPEQPLPALHLKLADFGLAMRLRAGEKAMGMYGSSVYMAPEVVCRRGCSTPVDIWSLGVILYTALCGYMPFWGSTEEDLFLRILRNSPDFEVSPWPTISPQAIDLVRWMLSTDPAARPTSLEALNHPWVVTNTMDLRANNGSNSNIMGTPMAPLPALVPIASFGAKGGSSSGAGAAANGAAGVSTGEEPLPLAQTGSGRSTGSSRARQADAKASSSGSSGAAGEPGHRSKKTREDGSAAKAGSSAMAVEEPEALRQSAASGLSSEGSTADDSLSLPAGRQPGSAPSSGIPSQAQGKTQGKAQVQVQVQEEAVNISERGEQGHTRGSKVVPVPAGESETAQTQAPGASAQEGTAVREGGGQVGAKQSAAAGTGAAGGSADSAGPGVEAAGASSEAQAALLGWGANLISKGSPPAQTQEKEGGVAAEGADEGIDGTAFDASGKLANDTHRIPPVTAGTAGPGENGEQQPPLADLVVPGAAYAQGAPGSGQVVPTQATAMGYTQGSGGGVPEPGRAEQVPAVISQEPVGSPRQVPPGVLDSSEQPQVYQQVQPAGMPGRQPRGAAPRSSSPFRFLRLSAYGRRCAHGPSDPQEELGREGAVPGAAAQGQGANQSQVTSPPTLSSRRFASPMRRGGGSPATKIFSGRYNRDQRSGMPGAGPHSGEITPRAWQGPKGTGVTASASASMVNSAANSPPEADAPDSPRRLLSFGSSGAGGGKLARSNTADFQVPGRAGAGGEGEGVEAVRPASPRLRPLFSPMRRRQNSSTSGSSNSGPVGRTSSSTSSERERERPPTLERRDSSSSSGLFASFHRRAAGYSGGPFSGGSAGVFAPAARTDSATEDPAGTAGRRMGVPRSASADRAPANFPANLNSWQPPPVEPATSAAAAASLAASAKAGVPPVVYQRHPVVTHSLETAGGLVGGEEEGALSGPAPSAQPTDAPSDGQAVRALAATQSKEAGSAAPAQELPAAVVQVADKAPVAQVKVEEAPGAPEAVQEAKGAVEEDANAGAVVEASTQEQASLPQGTVGLASTGGAPVAAPEATAEAGEDRGMQATVTPTKAAAAVASAPSTPGAGGEKAVGTPPAERAVRAPGAHKFQDEVRPRERPVGPVGAGGSPGGAPFVVGSAQPRRAPERAPVPGRSPGVGAQKRSPGAHSRPEGAPFSLPAGQGTGAGGVGQRPSASGVPQQVPWGGSGRRDAPRGGPVARPGASPSAAGGPARAAEAPAARASPSQATPASIAEVQAEQPTGPGARPPAARVAPPVRAAPPRAGTSGSSSSSSSSRQMNGEVPGRFPGGRSDSWGESGGGGRVGQKEVTSPGVYHRTGGAPAEGQVRTAAAAGPSDRFSDRYTPEKPGVEGVYKKLQESPPTLDRVMSRGLVQGVPLASPFQRSGSSKNYGRVTSMNAPSMGGQRGTGPGVGPGAAAAGAPPGSPSPAKGTAPVAARPPSPLRDRIIRFASPGRMRGSSSPSRRSES